MLTSKSINLFKNELYWEKACRFFSLSGYMNSKGSYFIHNKNKKQVHIGIKSQNSLIVDEKFEACSKALRKDDSKNIYRNSVYKHIEEKTDTTAPCFFLLSPDIERKHNDPQIPNIILVQPVIEFVFSPEHVDGCLSYAKNNDSKNKGEEILKAFQEKRTHDYKYFIPNQIESYEDIISNWSSKDNDESFLARIEGAIKLLAGFPDGKMCLTRSYQYKLTQKRNAFELYEHYVRFLGDYACSHFFCIQPNYFSLGCTPENVFEINDGNLSADVVAGTCKASLDNEFIENELVSNAKQIKEHSTSLSRRPRRYEQYCVDGSLKLASQFNIKRLRNVFHFHSIINGKLNPDVTAFDIFENIFPLLSCNPKELLPFYDEMEREPHRFYGGIVGRSMRDSSGCFLNLRNALILDDVIYTKVGVGVLPESDAQSELLETKNKISALMESVFLWEQCRK
ncbi:chorismate-binding protein [Paenibacillus algorifonticola]|uniref:chorismate-binding protein n=1 Tax=Paenibacillus algorifonticola TaxID=684063 RepID=UPI003D2A7F47